jgi:hypothetical protein
LVPEAAQPGTSGALGWKRIQINDGERRQYEVDDSFLHTGSANWSRSGLTYRYNDVIYIQLPQAVKAFEADFEAMWSRPDNLVLAKP